MAFNLSDVLKDVSNLDTILPATGTREQIEYIDIDLINEDPANFYELSAVDELAGNIETIGLQQPLRVRADPNDPTHVMIISGHRRRAAMAKLVADGRDDLREIPCIRESNTGSAALQELKVIYANSDTRRMSSADISKQALRIEDLLYQLKNEGYEFPGRMRDHVAEVCKISKSKLARLKVIREQLHTCWKPYYEKSEINESVAYALAQLSSEFQGLIYGHLVAINRNILYVREDEIRRFGERLAKVQAGCDEHACSAQCENQARKYARALGLESWKPVLCVNCCNQCPDLASCKHSCSKLTDRVKQIRADKKEARRQEALAKEKAEKPTIDKIQRIWARFGAARARAGKTVKEYYNLIHVFYSKTFDDERVAAKENGTAKLDINANLPYGYNFKLEDMDKLTGIADLFGCSVDYLLCRTDQPNYDQAAPQHNRWHHDQPAEPLDAVAKFQADSKEDPIISIARWNGAQWVFRNTKATIDAVCVGWFPLPADETEET